jgi:hypothetical protein
MIDMDRIRELEAELGAEDLAMIAALFFEEAARVIDRIARTLPEDDHDRAIHFLRSGALNIGLSGFAAAADRADHLPAAKRGEAAAALAEALARSRDALSDGSRPAA